MPENLSVETTGNGCPAVRSDPIEMYAVAGRDARIDGQSRFANPTTTWLEARSVLQNRKLKIKPLDVWDFRICKHNVNGRSPYTTKLTPTSIGLRLSSQRNDNQEGRQPPVHATACRCEDRLSCSATKVPPD